MHNSDCGGGGGERSKEATLLNLFAQARHLGILILGEIFRRIGELKEIFG